MQTHAPQQGDLFDTSSARARKVYGISRPSALAVLRLRSGQPPDACNCPIVLRDGLTHRALKRDDIDLRRCVYDVYQPIFGNSCRAALSTCSRRTDADLLNPPTTRQMTLAISISFCLQRRSGCHPAPFWLGAAGLTNAKR